MAHILKCDIKKFFANIDHATLLEILQPHFDERVLQLISVIVGSFYSARPGVGLPLGNLTSQLLVNVYMNEFDRYVKHKLKIKHYLRYADDLESTIINLPLRKFSFSRRNLVGARQYLHE